MSNLVNKLIATLFPFLFIVMLASATPAQEVDRQETTLPAAQRNVPLLRLLNLSPEQLAQIRRIRRENQGELRLSVQRLRQAQRALDEAIYSETADEQVIEERAREVAQAQAEHTRLRALTELRVRRVLTPQQINVFRDLQTRRRAGRGRDGERRRNLAPLRPRRRLSQPNRFAPPAPPDH